jgi:SNF2 family DNA or RNA helicase
MMQPSIRYRLNEVVELPENIERVIDVPLSDQQKEMYETFRQKLVVLAEQKQITAANAGACLNKLLQISGGWVYSVAPEYLSLDITPRLNLVKDFIEANDQKVLICAPYRHMVEGVHKWLNANDIESAMVHGDIGDREKIFHAFQDTDQYKVLVAHPATIGHGLTLVRANMLVWWSPIADFDIFDQANARIRRVGQQHKQQLLYLQATAAERRIYGILRRKENIQDGFLKLVEEITHERNSE